MLGSRRWGWLVIAVGLAVTLILAAGCKRAIVAEVTETPVGQETGVPDAGIVATAYVEATRAAEAEAEVQAEETAQGVEETAEATLAAATAVPTSVSPTAAATAEVLATVAPTVAPTAAPVVVPTNTPVPEVAVVSPTAEPKAGSSGGTTHVVARGENLFRIALRYGVSVQAIQSANGISNPALIYVGQRLVIPGASGQPAPDNATTHVVQPGENLFRIALRYNMSYQTLAQYNGITNPAHIFVGQVLRIPPH